MHHHLLLTLQDILNQIKKCSSLTFTSIVNPTFFNILAVNSNTWDLIPRGAAVKVSHNTTQSLL